MIYGTVNEFREATVELVVLGHTGQSERLEFVVDTGFDGSLSMHSAIAAALELPTVARGQGVLADGSTIVYDVCEAFIQWNGERCAPFRSVSSKGWRCSAWTCFTATSCAWKQSLKATCT